MISEPMAAGQVSIKASPEVVYRMVSDPTVMVGFSEELFRVRWQRGATGPAVGARFSGANRNGWHRWVTTCRITDAEPGRRFAYEVSTPFWVPVARWQYDLEPDGDGCTVTETNWARVPRWFIPFAILITGEPDRAGVNKSHIATTLGRLKEHLESRPSTEKARAA
jgi:uncharacterized protein YndB with AHSA1/START domain